MDELLPRIAVPDGSDPIDPALLFGRSDGGLVLEIGFGGGEHLAAEAISDRGGRFIGCEPFVNGVAKLLADIDRLGLDNVRIWPDDVVPLLARLPSGSLDLAYLLYPDPWPKRRQRKRRLLSDALLTALARCLRQGGELRFATDIDDYAGWALARIFRSPDFRWTAARPAGWRRPWDGWEATRYESKARRESRNSSYLTFERL